MEITSDTLDAISKEFKRKYSDYTDDLAEFITNYKTVLKQNKKMIGKRDWTPEELAEEAFIYHITRYAAQENIVKDVKSLLVKDEEKEL